MANENQTAKERPEYLLEVKGLKKYFDITHGFSIGKGKQYLRAVDGVSFAIRPGETLGLVGVGTVVHSMVDYYLALLIWQPVSRAAKLPASFTFSKS